MQKILKISNQTTGDQGEREVVNLIPCPNCGKKLAVLPPNYPLFDVSCTACQFRAQVKTALSKPGSAVFGAGWDVMNSVLKSGYAVPQVIVNFKWTEKGKKRQEIKFYPFIPKKNLLKRQLSPQAKRANYRMFNYTGLDKLPHFTLYSK